MKSLVLKLLTGGLAVASGCHAAADKTTTTPTAARPATSPASSPPPQLPADAPVGAVPFTGYHRYRGTVGGQPVTVELTIDSAREKPAQLSCAGFYGYDRHAAGGLVLSAPRPYQPRQPLVLTETDAAHANQPTGRWQAVQAAGPTLTGTWRSPAGRQLPFSLHEDYTDGQGQLMAVRYEVVYTEATVPCRPEREADETKAAYRARIADSPHGYSQPFLHLLGSDTLRPSLQALQCPVPAERRQQIRKAAREDDGCTLHTASLHVDYNAYGLLAWSEYW
ncbi:MAG: hypothetical protein EOO59_17620, partial [Hymenobacter sp.]